MSDFEFNCIFSGIIWLIMRAENSAKEAAYIMIFIVLLSASFAFMGKLL